MVVPALIAVLFCLTRLDWFGLLPEASESVAAQGVIVGASAWWGLRRSSLATAVALAASTVTLFLIDPADAVGLVPSGDVEGAAYSWASVLRVSAAWALLPALTGVIGTRLPRGVAIFGVLVILFAIPLIAWFDKVDSVIATLRGGVIGILLPVWWPALVIAAGLVCATADLAEEHLQELGLARWHPVLLCVGVLAGGLLYPVAVDLQMQSELSQLAIARPTEGGPLTTIEILGSFPEVPLVMSWDGAAAAEPVFRPRTVVRSSRVVALVLPALQENHAPGPHDVALVSATTSRRAIFVIRPPSRLAIEVHDNRVIVSGGEPGAALAVLVRGEKRDSLAGTFDARGNWESDDQLPPGDGRIVAQSGSAWSELLVEGGAFRRPFPSAEYEQPPWLLAAAATGLVLLVIGAALLRAAWRGA